MPNTASGGRESSLVKLGLFFCHLPELAVQSFDSVCRVYDFPDLQRVFKKCAQNFPVFLRLRPRHRRIDGFQIPHQFLDILVADIFGRASDLMDDTPMQTALAFFKV